MDYENLLHVHNGIRLELEGMLGEVSQKKDKYRMILFICGI